MDINEDNYSSINWEDFDYADWRYCLRCKNVTLSKNFCEICGSDIKRSENYIHPSVPVNGYVNVYTQLRKAVCLQCKGEITPGKACKNCGAVLENVCMNEKKSHKDPFYIDDYTARYCPKCGSKTSFYAEGLLTAFYKDAAKPASWVEFNKARSYFLNEKSHGETYFISKL